MWFSLYNEMNLFQYILYFCCLYILFVFYSVSNTFFNILYLQFGKNKSDNVGGSIKIIDSAVTVTAVGDDILKDCDVVFYCFYLIFVYFFCFFLVLDCKFSILFSRV